MDNKDIFASNLRYFMEEKEKSRKEVSEAIGVSYYTFTDWVNGKKFPRMDKVEKLAAYFGILKSDLIEKRTPEREEMQKKNDTLSDVIIRLRMDDDFLSVVETLYKLDAEQLRRVGAMLNAFVE